METSPEDTPSDVVDRSTTMLAKNDEESYRDNFDAGSPKRKSIRQARNGSFFSRDGEKLLTNIEELVLKNEALLANRAQVALSVRKRFLSACRQRVDSSGLQDKLPLHELINLRDEYETQDRDVYEILDLAVNKCEEIKSEFFYFRDFNRYNLTLQPNIWSMYPLVIPCLGVLAYYFFSAFLLCYIIASDSTCPKHGDSSYEGWLTAVYFASVTMSTVGYGDVSIVKDSAMENWLVFVGISYMIVSVIVAVTLVSHLGNHAAKMSGVQPSRDVTSPFLKKLGLEIDKDRPLYHRIRWTRFFRLVELAVYFLLLNLFGMLTARIVFVLGTDEVDWSWMTTFYWAIQTTTTIGYGDLTAPSDLKWFNILFAVIGTAFAAKLLKSLADLDGDLDDMRRFYDWNQMELSVGLIDSMESNGDGNIDEYEFLVASLIALNKVKKEDITEIMDKFREVAACGDDHQNITKEDIELNNRERYEKIREHDQFLHLI